MTIIVTFLITVFVGFLIFRKKENPYIKVHRRKWQNESDYMEYLKWLDKEGGDCPLPEIKLKSDLEVLEQVNKNLNS